MNGDFEKDSFSASGGAKAKLVWTWEGETMGIEGETGDQECR